MPHMAWDVVIRQVDDKALSGTGNTHARLRYAWVHSCVNEVPQRSGPQDFFRTLVYRERVPPYNRREQHFSMPHMAWAVVVRQDDDKVLSSVSSSIHTCARAGKNSTHTGPHAYGTCAHAGIGNTCAPARTCRRSGTGNTHAPSRYVRVHSCVNEVPQRSGPQDVFRTLIYRERIPPYSRRESFLLSHAARNMGCRHPHR